MNESLISSNRRSSRRKSVLLAPFPLAASFALIAASILARPAPAADAPPSLAEIEKLIGELAAPEFTVREAASQKLLAIGSAAVAPLQKALASDDVEQRMRAEDLIRDIHRAEIWSPSIVDLAFKESTVVEAFQTLAAQTANPINWDRSTKSFERKVTIEQKRLTYWQALDELCREADVIPHFYDDPILAGAVLTHGTPPIGPTAYSGALRMRLTMLHRTIEQMVQFDEGRTDEQQTLELHMALDWEQRFPLCRYGAFATIVNATTDAGEDLAQERKAKTAMMPLARRQRRAVFVSKLRPPTKPANKIAKLRVELDLVAAGEYQALALDAVSGGSAQSAGYEFELASVNSDDRSTTMTIRLTRPAPYDKFNAVDMVDEYLVVQDAKGNRLPLVQQNVTGDKLQARFVVQTPAKFGRPAKLAYQIATLRSDRRVAFEFENVPLPPPTR